MNIVEPYARLLKINGNPPSATAGVDALRHIEWCGRISHRSEEKQEGWTWERFIRSIVLDHGDWSIVEHATATVDFLVDRGITHEIVRHRLFSFTQESTRFVNYEKKMPPSFIMPEGLSDDVERAANGEAVEIVDFTTHSSAMPTFAPLVSSRQAWRMAIHAAEGAYRKMLAKGCAPQIARSVFPNALASRLIVTGNLRNWRHFFIMRTTKEAHPQMRQVAIPLLAEFKSLIPILFDDITPMDRQAEGMRRGR